VRLAPAGCRHLQHLHITACQSPNAFPGLTKIINDYT
jgi:hypothetical protein